METLTNSSIELRLVAIHLDNDWDRDRHQRQYCVIFISPKTFAVAGVTCGQTKLILFFLSVGVWQFGGNRLLANCFWAWIYNVRSSHS